MTDLTTKDLNERYPDDELKSRILWEIVRRFPFSIEDVRIVYETVGSFDGTIKACEVAVKMGFNSAMSALSFPKQPGPSETK